jgi:uncharacterized protein YjbI with pentapeptide repeats
LNRRGRLWLHGLDLSNADLSEANLCQANLSKANLHGAILVKADLRGANLYEANLSKTNTSFARLSWANLGQANLRRANLEGAYLDGANLVRANLNLASLVTADMTEAHLGQANLSGAVLQDANLSGANLNGANLTFAHLSWANLGQANLRRANLNWTHLDRTSLVTADMSGAHLEMANLSGANLSGANLSQTDLTGANLNQANLSAADLSQANLSGADLSVRPERADLREALYTDAKWLDGFDPVSAGAKKVEQQLPDESSRRPQQAGVSAAGRKRETWPQTAGSLRPKPPHCQTADAGPDVQTMLRRAIVLIAQSTTTPEISRVVFSYTGDRPATRLRRAVPRKVAGLQCGARFASMGLAGLTRRRGVARTLHVRGVSSLTRRTVDKPCSSTRQQGQQRHPHRRVDQRNDQREFGLNA